MTALIPRVRFGVSETRLALGFGMTKKIMEELIFYLNY